MIYIYNEEKRLKNEKKKKYCLFLLKIEINFDLNYKE